MQRSKHHSNSNALTRLTAELARVRPGGEDMSDSQHKHVTTERIPPANVAVCNMRAQWVLVLAVLLPACIGAKPACRFKASCSCKSAAHWNAVWHPPLVSSVKTACGNGAFCTNTAPFHRDMFSHPPGTAKLRCPHGECRRSDDYHLREFFHPTQAGHITPPCPSGHACADVTSFHRNYYSHLVASPGHGSTASPPSQRRRPECSQGSSCTVTTNRHRRRYRHPVAVGAYVAPSYPVRPRPAIGGGPLPTPPDFVASSTHLPSAAALASQPTFSYPQSWQQTAQRIPPVPWPTPPPTQYPHWNAFLEWSNEANLGDMLLDTYCQTQRWPPADHTQLGFSEALVCGLSLKEFGELLSTISPQRVGDQKRLQETRQIKQHLLRVDVASMWNSSDSVTKVNIGDDATVCTSSFLGVADGVSVSILANLFATMALDSALELANSDTLPWSTSAVSSGTQWRFTDYCRSTIPPPTSVPGLGEPVTIETLAAVALSGWKKRVPFYRDVMGVSPCTTFASVQLLLQADHTSAMVRVTQIGDSGTAFFSSNSTRPVRLTPRCSTQISGRQDRASLGPVELLLVQEHDVFLLGTDGLWDNMLEFGVSERALEPMLASLQNHTPRQLAGRLLSMLVYLMIHREFKEDDVSFTIARVARL